MEKKNRIKAANAARYIARYSLLIIALLVFTFALLSGSESFGGGIIGLIKNSPNTLPWVGLIGLIILAWKNELLGGISLTVFGIILVAFFNTGANFFLSTFILTISITLLSSLFLVSWYFRRLD